MVYTVFDSLKSGSVHTNPFTLTSCPENSINLFELISFTIVNSTAPAIKKTIIPDKVIIIFLLL
jgi:hypothetical protein